MVREKAKVYYAPKAIIILQEFFFLFFFLKLKYSKIRLKNEPVPVFYKTKVVATAETPHEQDPPDQTPAEVSYFSEP